MSFSDRRLLVELGAVLIIKLILITLIKIHYFSPDPETTVPAPERFFSDKPKPAASPAEPHAENKER
ncbi:hypothetical protein [uncultured Microbulbifer sp.]|uniref:hypothetical protein n=1 Tax=uncultured Microbulbifer sp. TaxID=348147 RepID=UPI00262CDC8F|nr:hypothetical protein [uncultured Microbulbifer sp.]